MPYGEVGPCPACAVALSVHQRQVFVAVGPKTLSANQCVTREDLPLRAKAWGQLREYDVLAIGEVNIDLIMSGLPGLPGFGEEVLAEDILTRLGGSTANFVVCCAKLGLRVAFVAKVGLDDFGDFLVNELERWRFGSQYITRDPELRTGVTVSLSGPTDRAFVTYVGTINSLTGEDIPDHLIASCRHVHVGSYFLQSKLQPALPGIFQRAHEAGASVALDTGFDPTEVWDSGVRDLLDEVDLFLPNEVEGPAIAGVADETEALRTLGERCGMVVMKLGAEGAVGREGERFLRVPGLEVDVLDTTCCGDAFDAGFTAAMLRDRSLAECLASGNACGALMATVVGNDVDALDEQALTEHEERCAVIEIEM